MFLAYFCNKQDHDFKPSAAPQYQNIGQVPPAPGVSAPHVGAHLDGYLHDGPHPASRAFSYGTCVLYRDITDKA